MLSARANGTDPLAALECTIGWQRLEEMVEAMDANLASSRTDNLAEVINSYPRIHRTATIVLGAFTFRSWKSTDSLLTALEVLRQLYASGERKLPAGVPITGLLNLLPEPAICGCGLLLLLPYLFLLRTFSRPLRW